MTNFPQVALAQVETVYPATAEVGVMLMNFANLHTIRVRVAAQHAGPYTGEFMLPQVGEFGVVQFLQDMANSGVWTTTLPSRVWNAAPLEVMQADPKALVRYTRDGARFVNTSDGDRETIYPDGSLMRVTHSKDGSTSNTTNRSLRTAMKRSVDEDPGANSRVPLREDYTPPAKAPVDVRFEHSSGAIVTITADGSFDLTTPRGHHFKLHDATEKQRDPDEPTTVTGAPEEAASRVASEVILETEMGQRLLFHDDPILNLQRYVELQDASGVKLTLFDDPDPGVSRYALLEHPYGHALELFHDPKVNANAYAELRSGSGHSLLMRDLAPDDIHILLQTAAGHGLELRDTPAANARIRAATFAGLLMELHETDKYALLETPLGRRVKLDDANTVSEIIDPVKVVVQAPAIEVGNGGVLAAVARVGDAVQVSGTDSGGDTVNVTGTITGGSSVVSAE